MDATQQEKSREQRLREMARRQGLVLREHERCWFIVIPNHYGHGCDHYVAGEYELTDGKPMDLEAVEAWLSAPQLLRPGEYP